MQSASLTRGPFVHGDKDIAFRHRLLKWRKGEVEEGRTWGEAWDKGVGCPDKNCAGWPGGWCAQYDGATLKSISRERTMRKSFRRRTTAVQTTSYSLSHTPRLYCSSYRIRTLQTKAQTPLRLCFDLYNGCTHNKLYSESATSCVTSLKKSKVCNKYTTS